MLPPKPSRPTKVHTGIQIEEDVLFRIDAIAHEESVKSRNSLIGSFLTFAADLFPLLRPMRAEVEEFAANEKLSYAAGIAELVRRGLKSKK